MGHLTAILQGVFPVYLLVPEVHQISEGVIPHPPPLFLCEINHLHCPLEEALALCRLDDHRTIGNITRSFRTQHFDKAG